MLPAEFEAVYGKPQPRVFNLIVAGTVRIQPDASRYLIVFWAFSSPWTLIPDANGSESFNALDLSTVAMPLTFTHALHGSLPGMGFRLIPSAPPASITVIEGFMKGGSSKRGGTNATTKYERATGTSRNHVVKDTRGKQAPRRNHLQRQ